MLSAISNAVSDVAEAANPFGMDADMRAAAHVAEEEIKKYTGYDISVVVRDCPDSWKDWMMKTGMNSLCVDDTWDFLENSESNAKKLELWKQRGIKKIFMKVDENPGDDCGWVTCFVDWETDSTECTVRWCPRAGNWSSDNMWNDSGYKRWWVIRDELVFGLQLYQLPGKCFYKSDWLDGIEDPDPDSPLPWASKKFNRWFQFRHWIIYWYPEAQWGYNYQWTEKPPKLPDGSDFSLDSILSLPSMPNLKMPSVSLPSLPGMPSMPSLPSLPSLSAPSLSMPSLSAPSLSAPSMPSIPEKPKRPEGRWACHGLVEMNGLKAKAKGSKLVLSDATVTHFWEEKNGSIRDEKKEHQRMELECTSSEQAESWVKSLCEGGAEEGEVGGCCAVA